MDEFNIIYNYLAMNDQMNPAVESLINWFSMDDIVEWFVSSYFGRDYDDLENALDYDEAKAIEEYYELHCI